MKTARRALRFLREEEHPEKAELIHWYRHAQEDNFYRYNSHLHSVSEESALRIEGVKAEYSDSSPLVDGREVLQACFDNILGRNPLVFAIRRRRGQDRRREQGFAGLQEKYGELRVTDTGIRGVYHHRPGHRRRVARTAPHSRNTVPGLFHLCTAYVVGRPGVSAIPHQRWSEAPLIIRTRGHRLEGVWHAGSQIGMLLHSLRGIYIITPRNMTQAAGFYNTMLQSDDPAVIIECLNGYRLQERVPDNITEFTVPLGVPDILREGRDVTIVTYGSMCRVVMEAAEELEGFGISCEVMDVQTLLPFDKNHRHHRIHP